MANDIPLSFSDGSQKLMIGLSWDPNPEITSTLEEVKQVHDLDLSCAIIGADKKIIDMITPGDPQRKKYRLQIFHAGDHQSGGSDYEDEEMHIHLDKIDSNIKSFVFLVSAKDGVNFKDVNNPECSFHDGITLEKFLAVDLKLTIEEQSTTDAQGGHCLTAIVSRSESDPSQWVLKPKQLSLSSADGAALEQEIQEHL